MPLVFANVPSPPPIAAGEAAWVLQVVTRGGFDGRGRPDVAITSEGLATCGGQSSRCAGALDPSDLRALGQLLQSAVQSGWNGSALGPCNDCRSTLLVLKRRGPGGEPQTYVAFWNDTTKGKVPPELLSIYERASRLLG